jgi:hypothetical protein
VLRTHGPATVRLCRLPAFQSHRGLKLALNISRSTGSDKRQSISNRATVALTRESLLFGSNSECLDARLASPPGRSTRPRKKGAMPVEVPHPSQRISGCHVRRPSPRVSPRCRGQGAPTSAAGTTMSPNMLMPNGRLTTAPIAAPSHPRVPFDIFTILATNTTLVWSMLRVTLPSSTSLGRSLVDPRLPHETSRAQCRRPSVPQRSRSPAAAAGRRVG